MYLQIHFVISSHDDEVENQSEKYYPDIWLRSAVTSMDRFIKQANALGCEPKLILVKEGL